MERGENGAFWPPAGFYADRGFTMGVYPYRIGNSYQHMGRERRSVFIGDGD
jgi:hypothetical protein